MYHKILNILKSKIISIIPTIQFFYNTKNLLFNKHKNKIIWFLVYISIVCWEEPLPKINVNICYTSNDSTIGNRFCVRKTHQVSVDLHMRASVAWTMSKWYSTSLQHFRRHWCTYIYYQASNKDSVQKSDKKVFTFPQK